jgi:hypothetical protein
MNGRLFLTADNTEIIWDIVYDNIKGSFKTHEQVNHAKQFFLTQAQIYYELEKNSGKDLIILNKDFMTQIMLSFHGLQQSNRMAQKSKPTPSFHENKVFLTVEEIHNERLSQFEKTLNSKRDEFNNTFTKPIPPKPDFSDPIDEPIGGKMDDLISRTMAERNLEFNPQQQQQIPNQPVNYEYKYQAKPTLIKIGEEIDLNPKKSISWGENTDILESVPEPQPEHETISQDNNIFSKLKKVNTEKEIKDIKKDIIIMNEKIDKILSYLENKIKIETESHAEDIAQPKEL